MILGDKIMYDIKLVTEDGRFLMSSEQFKNFVNSQHCVIFNERGETAYTVYNGVIIERED